jgi:hypothetical protein
VAIPADETWYLKRDGRRKLPPHCPIAANDRCPRYYLSQRYAADAGALSLELSADLRALIEQRWAATDVFADIEQSVAIWLRPNGQLRGVSQFCPEVTGRLFGLFCSDLRTYPDEESKQVHHKQLSAEAATPDDPRWDWMIADSRHYTECHEFSVYGSAQTSSNKTCKTNKRSLSPKVRFAVFARDGWRCIYCGRSAADSTLHVDHKISVANGGNDLMENLATACAECNLGKGAKNAGTF